MTCSGSSTDLVGGLARLRFGRDLAEFFDQLGEARCAEIELVGAGGADWIADVVGLHCARAKLCMDRPTDWASRAMIQLSGENTPAQGGFSPRRRILRATGYPLWMPAALR